MIKHIVCFKLKDNSLEECEKARDILKSMEGNVPLLRGIEVGVDLLHSQSPSCSFLEILYILRMVKHAWNTGFRAR